jgi:cation:H+ antiporter
MGLFSLSLLVLGYGFAGRPGRINRIEGAVLLFCYCGYTAYLISRI